MLNFGYKIALPVGVNLHPWREHALSVAVAALPVAVAALPVAVAALPVAVAMLRAALPVGVKI